MAIIECKMESEFIEKSIACLRVNNYLTPLTDVVLINQPIHVCSFLKRDPMHFIRNHQSKYLEKLKLSCGWNKMDSRKKRIRSF